MTEKSKYDNDTNNDVSGVLGLVHAAPGSKVGAIAGSVFFGPAGTIPGSLVGAAVGFVYGACKRW